MKTDNTATCPVMARECSSCRKRHVRRHTGQWEHENVLEQFNFEGELAQLSENAGGLGTEGDTAGRRRRRSIYMITVIPSTVITISITPTPRKCEIVIKYKHKALCLAYVHDRSMCTIFFFSVYTDYISGELMEEIFSEVKLCCLVILCYCELDIILSLYMYMY